MEKITGNNFTSLKNNKIILEQCTLDWQKSTIEFEGTGNIIYFIGSKNESIILKKTKIKCKGNNNLIFIHSSRFPLMLNIGLGHGCNIYIGRDLDSTSSTHIKANERTNVHIGEDCLFARGVWIRTSDMHMIYDIDTKKRINYNKNIFIGKHVWLGQDVVCLKGTVVGHGSVVGWGSVCTGKTTSGVNTIYTGRPAKLSRTGIVWKRKGTNQVTEKDMLEGKYDMLKKKEHIFEENEANFFFDIFESKLSQCSDMESRIQFFKDYSSMKYSQEK